MHLAVTHAFKRGRFASSIDQIEFGKYHGFAVGLHLSPGGNQQGGVEVCVYSNSNLP